MVTSINVSSFSSALRLSEGVSTEVSGNGPRLTFVRDLLGPAGTLEAERVDDARELLVEVGVRRF